MKRILGTGLLAAFLTVTGCGNNLAGRVVEGPSSVAVIIGVGDARLDAEGVAGVPIKLYSDKGEMLASVVSDEKGEFSLSLGGYSGQFRVRARTEEFEDVNSMVFAPNGEKWLLVVLEPIKPRSEDGG